MKKIILFISMFLLMLPAYAQLQANVTELKWDWLVPAELAYVERVKLSMWDSDEQRLLKEEYNYWHNRRMDFIVQKSKCDQLQDIESKEACLIDIVEYAKQENCRHIQQVNLKIAKIRKWNQISNSLNSFANTLNQSIQYQQLINAIQSPKVIINN